jgi:hypothetical protein
VLEADTYTVNAGYQRCRRCYFVHPRHASDCPVAALALAMWPEESVAGHLVDFIRSQQ